MKNLVLIGMMGSAKTTTGKLISKKLNMPFFDCDEVYESLYKEKVSQTFERAGESEFRTREKEIVKLLSQSDGAVIACGGGVVLDEENMSMLKSNGVIVCLTATAEAIYERVSRNDRRPLVKEGGIEKVKEIMQTRYPLYNKYADFTIDNTYSGINRSSERIISLYLKLSNK